MQLFLEQTRKSEVLLNQGSTDSWHQVMMVTKDCVLDLKNDQVFPKETKRGQEQTNKLCLGQEGKQQGKKMEH